MATLYTFGVDATVLGAYLPQVTIGGANDPITAARLTVIVNHSAARLCGIMLSAGLDAGDISAASTSVAYYNAQQITAGLALRSILTALTMTEAAEAADLAAWAEAMIGALINKPDLLGAEDSSTAPEVRTVVDLLNLDTSDIATRNRRRVYWSHDSQDGGRKFRW